MVSGVTINLDSVQVQKESATTTRSTRSSCVRFANEVAASPPTAVRPLSQRNSRR